jgi:two-component sensor histidine kinase
MQMIVGTGTTRCSGLGKRNGVFQQPAKAALSLGMAIHELTTNAFKHGALSVSEGTVRIVWHTEQPPDGEVLVLSWSEANGPPVSPPTYRGFGMTLIERGLRQDMSAEVTVTFQPEGVKATLRAPLLVGRLDQGTS